MNIFRSIIATTLFTGLASTALAGPRIAVVQSDQVPYYTKPTDAFLEQFDEPISVINIQGRYAKAQAIKERFKDEPPEVFFCLGAKAAYAIKLLFPKTPIVYASILAPSRFDIQGPYIAGVSMTVPPAAALSQYVSFFENTKRIGVIRGPNITNTRMRDLENAAARVRIELLTERARSPKNVVPVVHRLGKDVDAIWLQADRAIVNPRVFQRLVEETRRRQIGLIVESEAMVRAGALFAVVPKHEGVGTQAAKAVTRILEGASPREIGIESPTLANVVVNIDTMQNSNLEFDSLLLDFVDIKVE